jgi:hypothetical protein
LPVSAVLPGPSRSEVSIAFCGRLKSFRPRDFTLVIEFVVRSIIATAFASCSVTMALLPSFATAMYSGSQSSEGLLPGVTMRPRPLLLS